MWGDHGMGWGWGFLGMVPMLLWWALLILGIAVLVKWLMGSSPGRSPPNENRALEILRERYARGEIGKDEFEQKKRDLGG
ncbi:MAG TPA: electron transporter RnfE [Rhodocyclaceae bacterium]|nr:MAG: electron transporter RnfE [Betaproteobacteria bacterium CG2_30_68_42]PIV74218.1 MAG: electron transporter RnfE [Rhodocyclales bacterium CG17_big_fil_post_rev_8_21_14_2_50_68_7]PIX74790.1 MAG: electron transporter RnfE [Rhodocyclales bacterium CG_4_10_14_3_um_filter_68_10]PJA58054.1 MAG: electron transporter RnfE [Rhodocyclales bacterium CG_4_9_14_3_um_filter_68_10]HCX32533.1 electron transporter RnfE [Rhodocyclaceae bacterium]